jgi:hypothetical protein
MTKNIITIYGEDYDQVYTVASRLRNLTTIPIVDTVKAANPNGIMTSSVRQHFSGAKSFNHCVDTNDFIDDSYVLGIWLKADKFFFNNY